MAAGRRKSGWQVGRHVAMAIVREEGTALAGGGSIHIGSTLLLLSVYCTHSWGQEGPLRHQR